jgi:hypothetical protein
MSKRTSLHKPVNRGLVKCRPEDVIPLDYCRFCVHSRAFVVKGREIPSPARIYCLRQHPSGEEIDFIKVEAVICDDKTGEGYRSMMNIIS